MDRNQLTMKHFETLYLLYKFKGNEVDYEKALRFWKNNQIVYNIKKYPQNRSRIQFTHLNNRKTRCYFLKWLTKQTLTFHSPICHHRKKYACVNYCSQNKHYDLPFSLQFRHRRLL